MNTKYVGDITYLPVSGAKSLYLAAAEKATLATDQLREKAAQATQRVKDKTPVRSSTRQHTLRPRYATPPPGPDSSPPRRRRTQSARRLRRP
ncbi:hypothetical protein ACFWWM_25900 [Streptomyces sp. NPDC058682]|uniref:hypothetical protein n=1 Tax=Streptomyces sp. NPDC058682 TaxID=3346596 RepID=UPI0036619AF2